MSKTCINVLSRCNSLLQSGENADLTRLQGIVYRGDVGELRSALCGGSFDHLVEGVDLSKVSNDTLRNIGSFVYSLYMRRNPKNPNYGNYNAYITLTLDGVTSDDSQFIVDMFGMRASIMMDLIDSYVNPVYAINTKYKFNVPTTKGGGISTRNILGYYMKSDVLTGITILRKLLVNRIKTNLDSVYSKYKYRYQSKGKYPAILSRRDMDVIYADFIKMLISVDWDSECAKKLINTMSIDTIKFTSLNTAYNKTYTTHNEPINNIIAISGNHVILYGCCKCSFKLINFHPMEKKHVSFNSYYKRAILTYDQNSDNVYLKLIRYSTEIASAGYPNLVDQDVVDKTIINSTEDSLSVADVQVELFDTCYNMVLKYRGMDILSLPDIRSSIVLEIVAIFKGEYITRAYIGDSPTSVSLYRYIRRIVKGYYDEPSLASGDNVLECIFASVMSLIDCDSTEITFCEISKDGVILSCGYLHDLWLTYLEEKHKSK